MPTMCVVGYTMDTMYFSWQESPVEIDPGVQLPQFLLETTILYDCSQNYTAGQSSLIHFFQLIDCFILNRTDQNLLAK